MKPGAVVVFGLAFTDLDHVVGRTSTAPSPLMTQTRCRPGVIKNVVSVTNY